MLNPFGVTQIGEAVCKELGQLKVLINLLNQEQAPVTGETTAVEICHDLAVA
nr:hypothetical protein [Acaryochloris sp. IP29b_bin.137]